MTERIEQFNFSTFSFRGHSLIEASAGTGKTYIITMLYLRLLLGIHHHSLQALTIKEILLVTFTNIATEELRVRIRNNIYNFRLACMLGYSQNEFFSELLSKIDNVDLAYRQLLEAEQHIGSAQIFTIHGFCQRILDMCPIELHTVFQYNILKDETPLFRLACNDFWRHYFYSSPIEILSIIKNYWKDPMDLFNDISPYLCNIEINILPVIKEKDLIKQHESIINDINYVKNMWNNQKSKLLNILDGLALNRHVYNNKNLNTWCKNIDFWANEKITKDYTIPNELQRFRYSIVINNIVNVKNKKILKYPLFEEIEKLFKKTLSLKQLIFHTAIYEIRKIVKNKKNSSLEISVNDLIYLLDDALHNPCTAKKLSQLICEYYPVAIVDEFQDTDFCQYRIFQTLYSLCQSKCGLLLIGDPKQSIYSFRGADIFSYLSARNTVDFRYTLCVNWRSSKGMVNAINTLFQFNSSSPFVFQNIPFIPTDFSKNNIKLHLVVQEKLYPALHFWLPSCDKLVLREYQKVMGYQCAYTIYNLLHGAYHDSVWLIHGNDKRLLQPSDIVILVRNRDEGRLMTSILKQFNINSIYLSNQESIFKTKEADDLLLILRAILTPENSSLLRCALITDIIGYDSKKIDCINKNKEDWAKEVENFTNYYFFWEKNGFQPMLQEIIFRRCILKKLKCPQKGERHLINILHLGEILQKKSMEICSKRSLIYWFNMKINACDVPSDDELLRVQSFNCQLIKIITIHKAKGLEFPLVFLPFISSFYSRKYPLFHDRKSYKVYLDLNSELKNYNLSEEERLSEDLRLLYVAITRAIYCCFIGIGPIFFNKSNMKNSNTDLHRTALGYLVQNGISGNFIFLKECLNKLIKCSHGDIVYNFIVENQYYHSLVNNQMLNEHDVIKKNFLSSRDWKESVNNFYKITSYTEIHRLSTLYSTSDQNLKFKNIINFKSNNVEENDFISYTPHTFPRGNISGVFLHHVFQKWNFKEKIEDEWLTTKCNESGIDLVWFPMLQKWMNVIANTSLDNQDLMLANLECINCNTEFQFYLSINNLVSSNTFDKICKQYDPMSRLSSNLKFPDIIGMLHGFIDLVFFWKGKYYLLDYKSNWLGETYSNYCLSEIRREMVVQNYTLQYQIYTVALHRFLRHKLLRYNYEKDFGGVFYLFVRGMDPTYPGYGIYFCRPKKLLIDELDQLLSFSNALI